VEMSYRCWSCSCSWWSCPIGDEVVPVAGGNVL
jgi:hypothetical protein